MTKVIDRKNTALVLATKSLRFRRWSRKPYAIFHSLHQHVGIGNLSTAILDQLVKKNLKFLPNKIKRCRHNFYKFRLRLIKSLGIFFLSIRIILLPFEKQWFKAISDKQINNLYKQIKTSIPLFIK